MGSYLLARCFVRSAATFRAVVKLLFVMIVIMLPFTLAETLTGTHYLKQLLALFGPVLTPHEMDTRMGFERAFGVFDHPIHQGVFCVSVFSLTYYVLGFRSRMFVRYFRTGLVALGTACSMSSGPLLAMVVQGSLMAWDHVSRGWRYRWWIPAAMSAIMYMLVDIVSNRTPFHVIVTYLTFNTANAYSRIHVWYFGVAEVMRHPLYGIGLSEWERPEWMTGSMDNFWLVLAVQGGLPAFAFFAGAIFALCTAIARLRLTDPRLIAYRRGWMIAILGLAIAGATVHYWKTMFCLLVFLIGSAAWMLDETGRKSQRPPATQPTGSKKATRSTIQFG